MPNRLAIRNWVRAETLIESTMMSDADINAIIDQGMRDLSTRYPWPFLATTGSGGTLNFVAAQQAYPLPTNLQKLGVVLLDNTTTKLREISPHSAWAAYGDQPLTGTPSMFYVWGLNIHVLPVPVASTGGLILQYYRKITALTDDTHVPEFDDQFHLIVADYVCQNLWHREEDFSKARVYGDRYLAGVESMARYYLQRAEDQPFIMGDGLHSRTNPLSYFYPTWP